MSSPAGDPNGDLGPSLNTVTWIFTALALVAVVLRLYTRTIISYAFGWDDAVITWAMVKRTVQTVRLRRLS